jgi:hypothetical protein
MALIVSAASGNFNAGATWVGGVVPGVGDEAQAATGHTITITADVTCDEVSNAGTGLFILNAGVTLTANVTHKSATTLRDCLQFSSAAPAISNIVGNISTGSVNNSRAVNNGSSGTLNITGNCTGGTGTGTTSSQAAANISTGTLNITGNCTGGSSSSAFAANNASTGILNITGNCIGGSGAPGAINSSTGTMLVVGTIEASEFIGGVAGTNRQQVTLLTGPFLTSPSFGVNPIGCNAWRWAASLTPNTFIEVPTSDLLAKRNLVTADNVTGMPDEADVKDGVVYGPASELTGTFEQTVAPSVSDIAAAVWDEVLTGATHNIPSSAGRRLRILDDERIITDGQVQGAGTNTVTLEPITTLCIGQTVVVTDQTTGNKQVRFILAFDSATNVATVDTQWCDIPNIGDEYQLTTVRSPLIARNDYPSGTIGAEIDEMYLIHGLKDGETLTVTPTSRTAGAIAQTIGGDGTTTTTVSRD